MLTRSASANKIADAADGLCLIADISHGMLKSSHTAVTMSHKTEAFDHTAGPSCYSAEVSRDFDSSPSSTYLPLRSSISSHPHSDPRSNPKKTSKTAFLNTVASEGSCDRYMRIRELKRRALRIQSTGNAPATAQQRLVMLMVFNEITPYPDEAWLSLLSVLIDRHYHQVKNWFSNQRQKRSRENRENSGCHLSRALVSTLKKAVCEGRVMRLRSSALESCKEEDWTDQFFEEVVMVHNVKIIMRLRRSEAEQAMSTSRT